MDKPYSYRVPESLEESVACGKRVTVPFGRGNRRTIGLLAALAVIVGALCVILAKRNRKGGKKSV